MYEKHGSLKLQPVRAAEIVVAWLLQRPRDPEGTGYCWAPTYDGNERHWPVSQPPTEIDLLHAAFAAGLKSPYELILWFYREGYGK